MSGYNERRKHYTKPDVNRLLDAPDVVYKNLIKNKDIIPRKGLALDIGCGKGLNAKFVKDLGMDVEAFDYNESLKYFFDKYFKEGQINDLNSFNYDNEKYNLVLLIHVLHRLDRSEQIELLNNIHKTLKKGGMLFLGFKRNEDYAYKTSFLTTDELYLKLKNYKILKKNENKNSITLILIKEV